MVAKRSGFAIPPAFIKDIEMRPPMLSNVLGYAFPNNASFLRDTEVRKPVEFYPDIV